MSMDFGTVFDESYARVLRERTSGGNEFFDVFYDEFIASSPLVAKKFTGVDLQAQKTMLKQSFAYLLNLYVTRQIPRHLVEIARKHDRGHADICAELYTAWLDCLIATVRQFDPKFNDDVELAWRMVCAPGIAFMIFRHGKG
jgi:hemoglobin-like flavoprotein